MFSQCPLQEHACLFLRRDLNGKLVPLNWILYWQHSLQTLVWAGTGKVYKTGCHKTCISSVNKATTLFISPDEEHSCRHLSSFSEACCPAQPAWAEIGLHAAAAVFHCRKQLPALPVFPYVAVPYFHPSDLVTVFRETKSPSQMHFWNPIYFTTIGAFGYLSSPIPPLPSEATSPLFSGLQTSSLPEFTISAILLPGPSVSSSAVPSRMDSLPAQNNSLNLVLSCLICWE